MRKTARFLSRIENAEDAMAVLMQTDIAKVVKAELEAIGCEAMAWDGGVTLSVRADDAPALVARREAKVAELERLYPSMTIVQVNLCDCGGEFFAGPVKYHINHNSRTLPPEALPPAEQPSQPSKNARATSARPRRNSP